MLSPPGAPDWPRRPPRDRLALTCPWCRMLLLPPKEGVVDNFHISSKFGDFRQCWEAWLQLPEAHVEVIKPKKGGQGREGGRERRRRKGVGARVLRVASCQPGNMSKALGVSCV